MKKLLCLTLAVVVVLSCKDEPIDIRDASVGRYTGTATFYVLRGSTLVQTEVIKADPISISKKTSAPDELIIDFGDGDKATGTGVKESSTGLTFNLENFVNSTNFQFTGYPGYESDGNKYHGGFKNDGNQIELWYQYTLHNTIKVTKCSMARR